MRFATVTEIDVLPGGIFESAGYAVALKLTDPRVAAFHEQVATKEIDCTLIHPGIFLPLAKKVTFPSAPAVAIVAVRVL